MKIGLANSSPIGSRLSACAEPAPASGASRAEAKIARSDRIFISRSIAARRFGVQLEAAQLGHALAGDRDRGRVAGNGFELGDRDRRRG